MPTPSVFKQASAVPVRGLVESPRNYNASIIEFEGRRYMAYRSHRMHAGGRCGIVIAEFNNVLWIASANHWLDLPDPTGGTGHHEDPRLFIFNGRLHVAYTHSQFHGKAPYTCTMHYASLRFRKASKGRKAGIEVDQFYWPRYGKNDGNRQEKNWQFFEVRPGVLGVIYDPETIFMLGPDGESIAQVNTVEQTAKWAWGDIRGGTPPVRVGDQWLTIFHSSTPHPFPPHWRRYYAGAYTFDPVTFKIIQISTKPILIGSEEDGHGFDPRNIDSWKPFVVFPSGIIVNGETDESRQHYEVSYGINDHFSTVAEHTNLFLADVNAPLKPRYFYTENGTRAVKFFVREDQPPVYLPWTPAKAEVPLTQPGVMEVRDPRLALHLAEAGHDEISAKRFNALTHAPHP